MLTGLLFAAGMVAVTVALHAGGLAGLLSSLTAARAAPPAGLWAITWLLVRVAWTLIAIHALEISVWALFFVWQRCLPDAESAFYFSGVTYTTLGYGDLVLPEPWRLLGPIEALTGILMCGLSAGVFFAVVNRAFTSQWQVRHRGADSSQAE